MEPESTTLLDLILLLVVMGVILTLGGIAMYLLDDTQTALTMLTLSGVTNTTALVILLFGNHDHEGEDDD